jgi:hypothetical protein
MVGGISGGGPPLRQPPIFLCARAVPFGREDRVMAIRLLYSGGRYVPIIARDACGQRIEDFRLAMEINNAVELPEEGKMTNVFHVHKGACDRALEDKLGGITGSSELGAHLFMLAYNVRLRQKDFERLDEERGMFDQLP